MTADRDDVATLLRCAADTVLTGADGWIVETGVELGMPEEVIDDAYSAMNRFDSRVPRVYYDADETHTRLLEAALLCELGEMP